MFKLTVDLHQSDWSLALIEKEASRISNKLGVLVEVRFRVANGIDLAVIHNGKNRMEFMREWVRQTFESNYAKNAVRPCPLCGGAAKLDNKFLSGWRIKCSNRTCGCATPLCVTPELALQRWNCRYNPAEAR